MFQFYFFFFFKQKTAYELRISDWSSDVCSSDLVVMPKRLPEIVPLLVTLLTPPDRVMPASGGASKPRLPPLPRIVPALVIAAAPSSIWTPDSEPSIVASASLSTTTASWPDVFT